MSVIKLDLNCFHDDVRRFSVMYIEAEKLPIVHNVLQNICQLFDIEEGTDSF